MTVNKVILVGNLGDDPKLIESNMGGDAICNISVATSESYKDKATGEKKTITEWHRVVLYRKLAEIAGKYLKKGSKVYIEGKLRTRKWQDKQGQDKYTTEIVCEELKMLDTKLSSSNNNQVESDYSYADEASSTTKNSQQKAKTKDEWERAKGEFNDDSIPF